MARQPADEQVDIQAVVTRLRHAKNRILQTIEWARATEEVWRALNEAADNRRTVAESPASEAAWVFERATRDGQIVAITRVLDAPGRGNPDQTNRLSFPVCRTLLALPGVSAWFIEDAKTWNNDLGEANARQVGQRIERFLARLHALETEEGPNRARLIRAFRDENIAHELHFAVQRERPLYRHIREVLNEVMLLTEELSFIVEGQVIHWRRGEANRSASLVWESVAAAYPREG
ncbi:hypothetical protein M9M90_11635 [Phenylobacterium sp. LH3H17]|uniref:AbiU2 domain-containing protein n=1 Tax=Phenylobacterium sp. LH3H17 TaxID=2903901 RepID=UPI0020CA25A6|nr:hypothetical protein [Phenylobacterium sp. LH3H17]UTP37890.1 hypothetical protein M9M90_11635 [Phenylobacterium sp. LH3H17]